MICFPLDNTPYEAKDMGTYLATRTRGVFSSDGNLAVTPGESGLSVSVSPGLAWLKWSDFWGVAALQAQVLTLDLDTADGALKRIDAIVCRLDKVNNRAEIVVKKGAPSSAPIVVPPVRDANYDELYIATVLIGAGVISISASAITDQRLNEEYCGLMRDGVTGIPTALLQEQVQQLIDHLRAEVDGIEQGSEVMLKTVYDADGDGVVDRAAAADQVAKKFILQNNAGQQMAEFDGSADRTVQLTPGQVGALPAAGGTLTGLIRTQGENHNVGIEITESASKSVRLVFTSAGYMLGRYVDGAWKYNIFQHNPGSFNTSFYVGENLYSNGLSLTDSPEGFTLRPTGDAGLKLGTSDRRWGQIYSSVGSISTSDEREKNTIRALTAEQAEALLTKLEPVTYRLNDGESGRTHWGLVSQQVERAMEAAGLTDMEFAGFIRSPQEDGSDRYGLRYDEFIAPLISVVQKQRAEIDALRMDLEALKNTAGNEALE